jgi:hypothetical protein
VQTHGSTLISIAVAVVMKECSIYKLFFIGVTFFISCGFHDDERGNETASFINKPITKIPKLDDIVDFSATFGTTTTIVTDGSFEEYVTTDDDVYCNETFAGPCVASAAAMLVFAGLLYSASIWQKQPPVLVEPKESKTACIFIKGHKISYDVDLYATIANLKQKIGDRIGSDVIDDQFIIFAGKRLSDHKRLIDYNIQMHSTLFLTGRILGGSGSTRGRGTSRGGMLNGGRGHLNQRYSGGGRGHGGRAPSDGSGINRQPGFTREYSEESVLLYGLIYAGFDEFRQKGVNEEKNIERFRCCYGVGHKAIAALIEDLPDKDFQLKNLFVALNFLKTYNTQTVLSGWWDMDEKTVSKWTKHYQLEIQKLKKKKVSCMLLFGLLSIFILINCSLTFNSFR